jgi:hypothetical protein
MIDTVTLTVHIEDLDAFRTMLREQLAGDRELIRDIEAHGESDTLRPDATSRLMMVEDLAGQVGGMFGSGFAADVA